MFLAARTLGAAWVSSWPQRTRRSVRSGRQVGAHLCGWTIDARWTIGRTGSVGAFGPIGAVWAIGTIRSIYPAVRAWPHRVGSISVRCVAATTVAAVIARWPPLCAVWARRQ